MAQNVLIDWLPEMLTEREGSIHFIPSLRAIVLVPALAKLVRFYKVF
jgi:hypothetical protein